jgi:ubiquitin C-terminal hydrolase
VLHCRLHSAAACRCRPAEEVLDGENRYACDCCKQKCRATKWIRFEMAPNSLVLNLKRYGTGRFGKINKMLVYGETLDLGPYMADGAMDNGPVTYTLSAVLVHLDQVHHGNTTMCRLHDSMCMIP